MNRSTIIGAGFLGASLVALLSTSPAPAPQPAPLPDATPSLRGAVNASPTQRVTGKVFTTQVTVNADAGAAYTSTCVPRSADLGACPPGNGLQCVADAGWWACLPDAGWAQVAMAPSLSNFVSATDVPLDGGILVLFVDVRGSDTNACTTDFATSGATGPCATGNGAMSKLPAFIRQSVRLSFDAGVYPAMVVSGLHEVRNGAVAAPTLTVQGFLRQTTGLTGPAVGTASGGTTGNGGGVSTTQAFGTLQQLDAGWATNELAGRFLVTVSPSATNVIDSNTSTTVTITSAFASAPTSSTTYTVMDSAVGLDGGITVADNVVSSGITLSQLSLFGGSTTVSAAGPSPLTISQCQVFNTAASGRGVNGGGAGNLPAGRLSFTATNIAISGTSATGVQTGSLPPVGFVASALRVAGTGSGETGITMGSVQSGPIIVGIFTQLSLTGLATPLELARSVFDDTGNTWNARIVCASTSDTGIKIGPVTQGVFGNGGSQVWMTGVDISNCGTALNVFGPSSTVWVDSLSGSVATTGIAASGGAIVNYAKGPTTLTAGANEVNIENAEVVGTFAAGTTGNCRVSSTSGNYTRVCAR